MTGADDTTVAPESTGDVFADLDNAVTADDPVAEQVPPAADPEPTSAPQATSEQPQSQPQAQSDAIPAWRLREEAEARRQMQNELAQARQELAELRRSQEAAKPKPDLFEDPNAFVNHGISQALDPIKSQFNQMREQFSQMMAVQRFGAEKVSAAYQEMQQAIANRDPEAVMTYQRMMNGSMDPYGDMLTWHQRRSTVNAIGGDLDAYTKRIRDQALEEALKDSGFLQKAVEAARANARPVTRPPQAANVTTLPSVNRATAAADDDEPENLGEVLNQAFGGR